MRRFIQILLISLLSPPLQAQQSDPEWPCIQVLVPKIVIAVVWPQPVDPAAVGDWQNDAALVEIATRLSDIESVGETERRLIAEFSEEASPAARSERLNKLAYGIVALSNQRRERYIHGIKAYTRQQISIAKQIEASLNRLAELDANPEAENAGNRAEIEETLHWHQRVYDQRENAIQSLCERPVELEQTLSNVLRELAIYLP